MNHEKQRKLWIRKGKYLESLAVRHQDRVALQLVHAFARTFVEIQQLWLAYQELVVPTIEGLGQHLRLPPDGKLCPLSEQATIMKLQRASLTLTDFEGTAECSSLAMERSAEFRQLLQEVNSKLREYSCRPT